MDTKELRKLIKNKTERWPRNMIPSLLRLSDQADLINSGPGLNNAKFPSLMTYNENTVARARKVKSMIKFVWRRCCPIGHVKVTGDELVYSIHFAFSSLLLIAQELEELKGFIHHQK